MQNKFYYYIVNNLIKIIIVFILFLSFAYPCFNCSPPVANAGPDFTVINGGRHTLDGSKSYDPDDLIFS